MATLQDQFVTYEIAKKMKELGFDEPCLGYWQGGDLVVHYPIVRLDHTMIYAPLWQQAIEWLYKVHKVHCTTQKDKKEFISVHQMGDYYTSFDKYKTHKQAQEAAIKHALKLIK